MLKFVPVCWMHFTIYYPGTEFWQKVSTFQKGNFQNSIFQTGNKKQKKGLLTMLTSDKELMDKRYIETPTITAGPVEK